MLPQCHFVNVEIAFSRTLEGIMMMTSCRDGGNLGITVRKMMMMSCRDGGNLGITGGEYADDVMLGQSQCWDRGMLRY